MYQEMQMHVLVTNEINEASVNEILIYCYLKLNKTLSLSYKFIKIIKNEIVCCCFLRIGEKEG